MASSTTPQFTQCVFGNLLGSRLNRSLLLFGVWMKLKSSFTSGERGSQSYDPKFPKQNVSLISKPRQNTMDFSWRMLNRNLFWLLWCWIRPALCRDTLEMCSSAAAQEISEWIRPETKLEKDCFPVQGGCSRGIRAQKLSQRASWQLFRIWRIPHSIFSYC